MCIHVYTYTYVSIRIYIHVRINTCTYKYGYNILIYTVLISTDMSLLTVSILSRTYILLYSVRITVQHTDSSTVHVLYAMVGFSVRDMHTNGRYRSHACKYMDPHSVVWYRVIFPRGTEVASLGHRLQQIAGTNQRGLKGCFEADSSSINCCMPLALVVVVVVVVVDEVQSRSNKNTPFSQCTCI